MRKNGAQLAVYALEQIGVKYTFGIPGTHTTELYDSLDRSSLITPILVTHESGGSFMADALSRTSDSIGCLTIVPAAGLAYALSGIGEAFLAGIPMIVISGGVRRDSGRHYQLHQVEMRPIAESLTKAYFLAASHDDIIPMIYEAYQIATEGEPGPVFIEIPVEVLMFSKDVGKLPAFNKNDELAEIDEDSIDRAVDMLASARNPMMFLGWGAVDASEYSKKIAEKLQAPVALTLQGKSSLPNDHPLYTGCFLGEGSKPGGKYALSKHDCMLAVGCRFSEISTGSYGLKDPKSLIHIDINPDVFDRNFPSEVSIAGDSTAVLRAIWERLETRTIGNENDAVTEKARALNEKYHRQWLKDKRPDKVSPGWFFKALNAKLEPEDHVVLDDGKHTFLAAELLEVKKPRHLISPTDFNCMGYCIPASIAVKLVRPEARVVGIVGDGAAMMTGSELITASNNGLAPVIFVFNDGELGQIAQFQQLPLQSKTCTVLGGYNFEGLAIATGAAYLRMENDFQIRKAINEAFARSASGRPVLVDVNIDYSKKTMLTKGVMKSNLARFPLKEKARFITRMLKRKMTRN